MEYRKNINTKEVLEAKKFIKMYNKAPWVEATEPEYLEYIKPTKELEELKVYLDNTDYQSLKAQEGVPSDDWETIKAEREVCRVKIRELEG